VGRGRSTNAAGCRVGCIGKAMQEQTFAGVDSLRAMAEAFADAVEGRAPFPITPQELVDVAAAFEAVVTSLVTGAPVTVP
jgi:predicted dehydrogenase